MEEAEDRRVGRSLNRRRGGTLIELLVVMAIIALLISLFSGVAVKLRHSSRSLHCRIHLRAVALDFQLFADVQSAESRGHSEMLSGERFYLRDFVDREYRIDEFWEGSDAPQTMSDSSETLMCPAGAAQLVRYPDQPCDKGAVKPFADVSVAFNRRLYAETIYFEGRPRFNPDTLVTSRILEHPHVPLAFDVDGAEAERRNRVPYFSAPPVPNHEDLYAGGTWWFPSDRHSGKTNVVFVGGHVLSSDHPQSENGWDWKYQSSCLDP